MGKTILLGRFIGLNSSESQPEALGSSRIANQATIILEVRAVENYRHSFLAVLDDYTLDRCTATGDKANSLGASWGTPL